ncbi:MAG: FliH/SctL family protein [Hyphomicrobiales bacterium]|nr:FliH/SctL family protein [Hyphomicrobiales bacterium]
MPHDRVPIKPPAAQASGRPFKFRPAGQVIRAEDVPIWSEGKTYLNAAKEVYQEARQRADDRIKNEMNEGYAIGLQRGAKDIIDLLVQTQAGVERYHSHLQTTLADLTIQVLKEVLDGLDASDAVSAAVQRALKTINLGPELVLKVAPDVIEAVRVKLKPMLQPGVTPRVILREDTTLTAKSCILITEFGSIDLSIDTQLTILSESLHKHCTQEYSFRATGVLAGAPE